MAEDFQQSNWWNSYRGSAQAVTSPSSSFLFPSAAAADGGGGGATFSWMPGIEIFDSEQVRLCGNHSDSSMHISSSGFSTLSADWSQTPPVIAEKSLLPFIQDDDFSTKPISRRKLEQPESVIQFKDITFASSSSPPPSYMTSSPSKFPHRFSDGRNMVEHPSQMAACHGVSPFERFSQKQQFTKNYTSFWKASAGLYPSPLPPSKSQHFQSKSGLSVTAKNLEGGWEKQAGGEPALKRTRIETLSRLPAMKARKEKLGERITVLQQLVSPFGKTDTSSVLHEAMEHIKFLHGQVSVLCNPYLKIGLVMQHKQKLDKRVKPKGEQGWGQDVLRSRGLCLVPLASIYPVVCETATADF